MQTEQSTERNEYRYRMFPESFDAETMKHGLDRPIEASFEGQRQFFGHLERELEAAWQAGHSYLTVKAPAGEQLVYGLVIGATFIPHDDPDAVDTERPVRDTWYTFFLPELFRR